MAESEQNSPLSNTPPTSVSEETPESAPNTDRFNLQRYFSIDYDFVTDRLRVSRTVSEDEFRQICMEASAKGVWEDAVTLALVAQLLGYQSTFKDVYTPETVAEMAQREGEYPAAQNYILSFGSPRTDMGEPTSGDDASSP